MSIVISPDDRLALRRTYLFSGMEEDQLETILSLATPMVLDAGQRLFQQGDSADNFFWVSEGMVRLYRSSPQGDEKVIELISPGRFFAEAVLFMGGRYPVNAVCHAVHGFCLLWLEGPETASRSYARALALNPGDPYVQIELALLNGYRGDMPTSRKFAEQAHALDPLPPRWYAEFEGIADFVEGRHEKAVSAFLAVPEGAWDTMYALTCLGHIGDRTGVARVLERVRTEAPHWDYVAAAHREPFVDSEPKERLIAGLEKALSF